MNRQRLCTRCCVWSFCLIWAAAFCFAPMPAQAEPNNEGSGEETSEEDVETATEEKEEEPE